MISEDNIKYENICTITANIMLGCFYNDENKHLYNNMRTGLIIARTKPIIYIKNDIKPNKWSFITWINQIYEALELKPFNKLYKQQSYRIWLYRNIRYILTYKIKLEPDYSLLKKHNIILFDNEEKYILIMINKMQFYLKHRIDFMNNNFKLCNDYMRYKSYCDKYLFDTYNYDCWTQFFL